MVQQRVNTFRLLRFIGLEYSLHVAGEDLSAFGKIAAVIEIELPEIGRHPESSLLQYLFIQM